MRCVRCEQAARKISGADECEVLLQEVMLDLPHVVDAQLVAEFHLSKRFLIKAPFRILAPGLRQLVLVEHAEFHCCFLPKIVTRARVR